MSKAKQVGRVKQLFGRVKELLSGSKLKRYDKVIDSAKSRLLRISEKDLAEKTRIMKELSKLRESDPVLSDIDRVADRIRPTTTLTMQKALRDSKRLGGNFTEAELGNFQDAMQQHINLGKRMDELRRAWYADDGRLGSINGRIASLGADRAKELNRVILARIAAGTAAAGALGGAGYAIHNRKAAEYTGGNSMNRHTYNMLAEMVGSMRKQASIKKVSEYRSYARRQFIKQAAMPAWVGKTVEFVKRPFSAGKGGKVSKTWNRFKELASGGNKEVTKDFDTWFDLGAKEYKNPIARAFLRNWAAASHGVSKAVRSSEGGVLERLFTRLVANPDKIRAGETEVLKSLATRAGIGTAGTGVAVYGGKKLLGSGKNKEQ